MFSGFLELLQGSLNGSKEVLGPRELIKPLLYPTGTSNTKRIDLNPKF